VSAKSITPKLSLKKNALANYLGQGWQALMGLAFIPLYIRYLGAEAWGLVGFMVTMQAWFLLLDMGMSPALSREMARFTAGEVSASTMQNLLHSLEIVLGVAALLAGLSALILAPWLADHWLRHEQLPTDTVVTAIAIMGWIVASRIFEQLYRGALQGLQRQVWLNTTQALMATVRWAGAIGVLTWISSTVEAFFIWQGIVSLITVVVLTFGTHHFLPASNTKPIFSWTELQRIRRYAGGMLATSVLVLFLTQIDKLLLSTLLPLRSYGYYMLAASVAVGLGFLVSPLASAVMPHFTELVARNDKRALIDIYHRASQFMAIIVVPPALVMAIFAKPLLLLWSSDIELAEKSAPLMTLLVLGTMFNAFMNIPYMLQLAHGWSWLAARINFVAVIVLVPALFYFIPRHGAVAAAWIWLILNFCYVIFGIHFMHYRLLPDEKWKWYKNDVVIPLLTAASPVLVVFYFWPVSDGLVWTISGIFTAILFSYISVFFFTLADFIHEKRTPC
jgi:O-antigen/teichoic acid export membrane protein